MTCMTPMALATETWRWFQPDSCQPTARASLGSTPWRRAVAMIIALVWLRLGTEVRARAARLRLAALTIELRVGATGEGVGARRGLGAACAGTRSRWPSVDDRGVPTAGWS